MNSKNAKNAQLSLIETPRAWRLDEHTRAVGREGVARARAALRAGLHTRTQDPPGPGSTSRRRPTRPPRNSRRAAA
ncbi:MAG TPA: hypothetical protein VF015_09765 [Acidimicrobiales bacterium]